MIDALAFVATNTLWKMKCDAERLVADAPHKAAPFVGWLRYIFELKTVARPQLLPPAKFYVCRELRSPDRVGIIPAANIYLN